MPDMQDEFSDVFDQIVDNAGASEKTGDQTDKEEEPSGPSQSGTPEESLGESVSDQQGNQDQPDGPFQSDQPKEPVEEPEGKETDSQQDGQAKPESKDQEGLEELKKKAHGYDSMLGRLEKERRERRELEDRLKALEGASEDQNQPDQDKAQGQAQVEISEDMVEDVDEFKQNYPDYAWLITEDSDRGKALRNLLQQYGPDMASLKAETVSLQDKIYHQEEIQQKSAAQAHWEKIAQDHSDVVADLSNEQKAPELNQKIEEWIENKPYKEALELMEVKNQGSADKVVDMLSQFKAETGYGQGLSDQETKGESEKAKADTGPGDKTSSRPSSREGSDPGAAAAVPSRPASPPAPRPSRDDFDTAWEEAVKEGS